MKEDKRLLRKALRNRPSGGDDGGICKHILSHPWFQAADTVMAFAAIAGEPKITPVLQEVLRLGKRLVLPRCEADGTMTGRYLRKMQELVSGTMGILEPSGEAPVAMCSEIDLILVPGMAFDRSGGRLGRGKGYYDRFLAGYTGRTIGICYQGNLLEAIPMEQHDKRMDAVVTDQTIIMCETEGDACLKRSADKRQKK